MATNPVPIKQKMIDVITDRLIDQGWDSTPVLYGLEDGASAAGQEGWVSVHGVAGAADYWQTSDTLDRYRVGWNITVAVGSGYSNDPVQSETRVFDLGIQTALALEADHTLGGLVESTVLNSFGSVIMWGSDDSTDRQQAVINLDYLVVAEGIG